MVETSVFGRVAAAFARVWWGTSAGTPSSELPGVRPADQLTRQADCQAWTAAPTPQGTWAKRTAARTPQHGRVGLADGGPTLDGTDSADGTDSGGADSGGTDSADGTDFADGDSDWQDGTLGAASTISA